MGKTFRDKKTDGPHAHVMRSTSRDMRLLTLQTVGYIDGHKVEQKRKGDSHRDRRDWNTRGRQTAEY